MSDLANKTCVPCMGNVPALRGDEANRLLRQLADGWSIVGDHHLEKKYRFPDFRQALDFVGRIGELAERQGHHPDIHLAWGKVVLTVWTHKIDGLTESDFVFAAKADLALEAKASNRSATATDETKVQRMRELVQEAEDIRRAVYDGMQDLRAILPGKRYPRTYH
ncbi:MAG: 4a-hydroxytetrahydrobiopterin dehydratase [Betaproteobacteria bacterium]|nr:4a-hydroxytetrahydrobiopterin dehydratase [Betaproteobacteria bacterium]MBI2960340.1 4a-hydroxytetrahydrobiopterin dehydratase [Betaproteobacteria bacterium]